MPIQSVDATAMLPVVSKVKKDTVNVLFAAITQSGCDSMAKLHGRSEIIRDAEKSGKLRVTEDVFRLSTGKVESFG